MSLPNTVFPKTVLEVVRPRPPVQDKVLPARARSQPEPSLPSRIAVIGNYLPRHCGIATFTRIFARPYRRATEQLDCWRYQ